MDSNEVNFLRDQVDRLTRVLSRYQAAYPGFVVDEYGISEDDARSQIWLTSGKDLSPLLREYDAAIYGYQNQLQTLHNEIDRLKGQSQDLVRENERLHQELKTSVQSRMADGDAGGGRASQGTSADAADEFFLQNLQQQIDICMQEKEAAQERWRDAAQEVDRLEAELEMEKDSHQWRVVEQQAHQVKDQYQKSVVALNGEVDNLHDELKDRRSENENLVQKVSELKLTVNNLQQQLIWKDQENADNIFKEGISDSKIAELKRIMDDLRTRLSEISKEGDDMRRENSGLQTRITELQRRLSETEVRETEAISQVREAIQMVEASVMEKDQAEIVAKQKDEELEEMRGVVSKIINKAGARTREEVDAVRKQCNDRIAQLTEELHALEMEGTEKQSRLDRLLREKRAVESELQKIYKDGMVEGTKAKEAYEMLNQRAIDAERGLNEANVKLDNLQTALDKTNIDNKNLKQQLDSDRKQFQERLASIQSECEQANEEKLECVNKMNQLNKKLVAAQQEREAAHRKFTKELALIESDQQVKSRDLEVKLQTTEDSRRQTVSELRRLLTAQQRMSARWKEECQTITHKFEGKLEEMRRENAHIKKRNEELTSLLKDSQAKTSEVERMLSDYTKNIRRMEERVREAELQAGDATKQVARYSMRERQMTTERESLLAELARSHRNTLAQTDTAVIRGSKKGPTTFESSYKADALRGELTLDQLHSSTKLRSSTEDR